MKKMTALLLALGLLTAAACAAAPVQEPLPSAAPHQLTEAEWSRSGDMEGGSFTADLCLSVDGKAELTVTEQATWQSPVLTRTFTVPVSDLNRVDALAKEYSLASWGEMPAEEMEILDGPTSSLYLRYGSGEVVSVSGARVPEGMQGALAALRSAILESARNENSLVTWAGEEAASEAKKGMRMRLSSVESGYARVCFENGSKKARTVRTAYALERKNDDGWEKLKSAGSALKAEKVKVEPETGVDLLADLNRYGKLEPGEYRLTVSGFTVEFTLVPMKQ